MCTWVGLDRARWLTDLRQQCDVDNEIFAKLGAKNQIDYKDKLQNNALSVQAMMRPKTDRLCPQCGPNDDLLPQFKTGYPVYPEAGKFPTPTNDSTWWE